MLFGVEVFHRLVIEQAVDRLGIGVLVRLIHVAAKLDAPAGDRKSEPDIKRHRDQHHHGAGPAEREIHFDGEHDQNKDGRKNTEDGEGQQRVDAFGAAFDHPAEAAGLAFQVKAQRQ